MPLPKIFKRKPKEEKVEKKETKKKEEIKVEEPLEKKVPKVKKEIKIGEAYRILKIPHIAEKATVLSGKNQYVFRIWPRANKVEVKKAIQDLFGVDVVGVKIINIPKKKSLRHFSWMQKTKFWKKRLCLRGLLTPVPSIPGR